MASPTRFLKIGLQGAKGTASNKLDSYIKTVEFPVVAVASAAAQNTGVKTPTQSMQVISSYLKITTAEATAAVKTVDIGITGSAAVVQNDTSVAATGVAGTPITAAIATSTSSTFTYTLAGADFANLAATCIITYIGIDA